MDPMCDQHEMRDVLANTTWPSMYNGSYLDEHGMRHPMIVRRTPSPIDLFAENRGTAFDPAKLGHPDVCEICGDPAEDFLCSYHDDFTMVRSGDGRIVAAYDDYGHRVNLGLPEPKEE